MSACQYSTSYAAADASIEWSGWLWNRIEVSGCGICGYKSKPYLEETRNIFEVGQMYKHRSLSCRIHTLNRSLIALII